MLEVRLRFSIFNYLRIVRVSLIFPIVICLSAADVNIRLVTMRNVNFGGIKITELQLQSVSLCHVRITEPQLQSVIFALLWLLLQGWVLCTGTITGGVDGELFGRAHGGELRQLEGDR